MLKTMGNIIPQHIKGLVGKTIRARTVIEYTERRGKHHYLTCKCENGTTALISSDALIYGSGSCICLPCKFWRQVDKQNSCWVWRGATGTCGYGRLLQNKKELLGHRISWLLHFGPIPDGVCVLHKCDNPPCVNPEHLFLGTRADNNLDKLSKGRAFTKLDVKAITEIRLRHSQGETRKSLALEYGVAPSSIGDIVHRRTWKHLSRV